METNVMAHSEADFNFQQTEIKNIEAAVSFSLLGTD
jgi:hypothetical protein